VANPNPFAGMVRGECQVCHQKVDGRSFYCSEHKPARSNRKTSEAEPISVGVTPPKSSRKSSKGPSAETYWSTFGDAIVILLNYVLLKPLDGVPDSEAIQEKMMVTKDEAQTLTRPLLRVFSQTSLSRSKGGMIIENADVIPALIVAMSIVEKMKAIRTIVENNQTENTHEIVQTHHTIGPDLGGFGPVFVEDLDSAQG
jgi:hypothetical protein